jgi:hypothetical protein
MCLVSQGVQTAVYIGLPSEGYSWLHDAYWWDPPQNLYLISRKGLYSANAPWCSLARIPSNFHLLLWKNLERHGDMMPFRWAKGFPKPTGFVFLHVDNSIFILPPSNLARFTWIHNFLFVFIFKWNTDRIMWEPSQTNLLTMRLK